MQVGDIRQFKSGSGILIITHIDNNRKIYSSLGMLGNTITDDDNYFLTEYTNQISSHKGSLKAGMEEFMDKYYKGE